MMLDKHSIHIIPAAIISLIILILTFYANKIVQKTILELNKTHNLPIQIIKVVQLLTKILIYSVGIILILENLHIQISAIFGTFGVVAIGIGLALQSTLTHMTSGLFILYNKPFFVGDYIIIETNNFNNKIEGTVIDINLRSTELEYKDTKIIVPNDFVYSSAVTVKKTKI